MPPPVGYLTESTTYVWHFDRRWSLCNAGIVLNLRNLDQSVFGNKILKGQKSIVTGILLF